MKKSTLCNKIKQKLSFAPKSGSIVVTTSDKLRSDRRVNNTLYKAIMPQRKQLLSFGISAVPATKRSSLLVWIDHEILVVIKRGLSALLLLAGRASARVRDQTTRRRQLPKPNHRVLATGKQILGVAREHDRCNLLMSVRVHERVYASVADTVPDLDRTVLGASGENASIWTPFDAGHRQLMLIVWIVAHKALTGLHSIQA